MLFNVWWKVKSLLYFEYFPANFAAQKYYIPYMTQIVPGKMSYVVRVIPLFSLGPIKWN